MSCKISGMFALTTAIPTVLDLRSHCSKWVRGQVIRIRLKIAKKRCLYLDSFSCVKINVFRSFFAFRLETHVRCDNQYKSGADGGDIFGTADAV